MKHDDFIDEVREFVSIYCSEYAQETPKVTYDFEDPQAPAAEIVLIDRCGYTWSIQVSLDHDTHRIGIDIGDAGYLSLDGQGLYCHLWHEAVSLLRYTEKKLENAK